MEAPMSVHRRKSGGGQAGPDLQNELTTVKAESPSAYHADGGKPEADGGVVAGGVKKGPARARHGKGVSTASSSSGQTEVAELQGNANVRRSGRKQYASWLLHTFHGMDEANECYQACAPVVVVPSSSTHKVNVDVTEMICMYPRPRKARCLMPFKVLLYNPLRFLAAKQCN